MNLILVLFSHFDAAVGRDEVRPAVFLQRFAGIGPVEWVGHRGVVVDDELSKLRLEFEHRGEIAAAEALALEDTEKDFDLVEPRTVFRQVNETDAVAGVREELAPSGHRFQDPAHVFFPSGSDRPHCSATQMTRLSEACVFRLSTMKVHSPVGSRLTVRASCATNSGSVRVASNVGETIWPVTTSRPAVSVVVP